MANNACSARLAGRSLEGWRVAPRRQSPASGGIHGDDEKFK